MTTPTTPEIIRPGGPRLVQCDEQATDRSGLFQRTYRWWPAGAHHLEATFRAYASDNNGHWWVDVMHGSDGSCIGDGYAASLTDAWETAEEALLAHIREDGGAK